MLTEDKKAFKKVKPIKNKVRFNLNFEDTDSSGEQHFIKRKRNKKKEIERKKVINLLTSNKNINSQEKQTVMLEKISFNDDNFSTDLNKRKNVIKVCLENNFNKFFIYDSNTLVKDVLIYLKEKLVLKNIDYYGLCIRVNNNDLLNHDSNIFYLDETRSIQLIIEESKSTQFYFRIVFKPLDLNVLLNEDLITFNYLYQQV